MNNIISDILMETKEPEKFRESLIRTEGDFDFSIESMVRLGEVYCLLYPASISHGDSAQVQAGYRIVRISIAEYILRNMNRETKIRYREMFSNISVIGEKMAEIVSILGFDAAVSIHKELDSRIKMLKNDIDMMDNSIIKERFTGGIAVFYNILYLMKKTLNLC